MKTYFFQVILFAVWSYHTQGHVGGPAYHVGIPTVNDVITGLSSGVNTIVADTNSLEAIVSSNTPIIGTVGSGITATNTALDSMITAVGTQSGQLGTLASGMSGLMSSLSASTSSLNTQLGSQLTQLDSILGAIPAQTTSIKACLGNVDTAVTAMQATLDANTAKLDALTTLSTNTQTTLDGLVAAIDQHEANRDADVDAVLLALNTLDGKVKSIFKILNCPSGWQRYKERCFKFIKCWKKNACRHSVFENNCAARSPMVGAPVHLARVWSREDNNFIAGLDGTTHIHRLGIGGKVIGGDWMWPQGLGVTYTNWVCGCGGSKNGDCMYIMRHRRNRWDYFRCSKKQDPRYTGFVCEFTRRIRETTTIMEF